MKMIIAYIRTEPPPTSCAICTAPASGELPVIRCMEDAVNDRLSLFDRRFEIHHLPAALTLEVVCPEERCDAIVRLIPRRVREIAVTALSPSST
jgi:hypothetical protein